MKAIFRSCFLVVLSLCLYSNAFSQKWVKVSAGGYFSVALRSDGRLYETGDNAYGQLGTGNNASLDTLTQVSSDTDWADIAAGGYHVLALKRNGSLWAWGDNYYGQCASTGSNIFTFPVEVGSDTDWVYISASFRNSYAIKRDGSIWAWGYNHMGQLGDSTQIDNYAIQKIDAHKWKKICGGRWSTVGLRQNGTLWSWGGNNVGQLGNGTYNISLRPAQIGTDTDWADVSSGFNYVIAIKKNGSLWSWGYNVSYQLGQGDTARRLVPTRIGADTNWRHVYAGSIYAFASKTDSSLYAWGYNYYGSLANRNNGSQWVPEHIGNGHSWIMIAPGCGTLATPNIIHGYQTMALEGKASTICIAGDNSLGQLGNGNNTSINEFDCSLGSPTGIEKIKNNASACTVYPNPTNGKITVDFTNYPEAGGQVSIFNSSGQLIYTDNNLGLTKPCQVDISNYPNGIYLIRVVSDNDVFTTKVIKEN